MQFAFVFMVKSYRKNMGPFWVFAPLVENPEKIPCRQNNFDNVLDDFREKTFYDTALPIFEKLTDIEYCGIY